MNVREYMFSDFLEDDEKIIFVARRHFFIFMEDCIKIVLVHGGLPAVLWYFFPQLTAIYLIWAGLGIFRLIFVVQDWYFDAWLITNMGIVEVLWTGYFDRTSTRIEYQSIEGVTYRVKGFWQTMFNYGNLTLAKFGGPTTMTLKDANNPKRIERNIIKNQEKYMHHKSFQDQEVLKDILSELVVSHINKHGLPDLEKRKEKNKEHSKQK